MKKWVINSLIVLFVLVLIGSGCYLFQYFFSAKQTEEEFEELLKIKIESAKEDEESVSVEGQTVLKEYRKLYKRNSDLIGWIKIDGTKIDYPVMQTPDKPEYYFKRNINRKEDKNGLPFLDAKCSIKDAKNNLLIYGHHMKSGLMFASLESYENKEFYQKHKTIELDSLYEKRTYEVVAVFRCSVEKNNQGFPYYEYGGSLSKKKFETYVEQCKRMSIHNTGVTPKYGEQLLTLVTCAYHTEEGRFLVVAKRK